MSTHRRRSSEDLRIVLAPRAEAAAAAVGNHQRDSLLGLAELGRNLDASAATTAEAMAIACYRAVISTTADGFFMAAADGKILEANETYAQLLGYTHAELATMSIADLEAKETLAEMTVHFERARRHSWDRFETILAAKDGSRLPVDTRTSYLPLGGGRFFTFVRDLRERHYVEQAHRESEEQSRATFEQVAVGMAHVSLGGRWLRVNKRLTEIVGYSAEELRSMTFLDITHPDDMQRDVALARDVMSGKLRTYSIEKRYIKKDGSPVWINLTVSLRRSESGEPLHFISVIEDISVRKRAEQARLLQNHVLQVIASGVPLRFALEEIVRLVEQQLPRSVCSILLCEEGGKQLRLAVAPQLPLTYQRAIATVPIGPHEGSCGTAAYRGEAVLVSDVETDPLYERYRKAALAHGLRSCWSVPIFASGVSRESPRARDRSRVLGTFAIHGRDAQAPQIEYVEILDTAAHLTGIALERASTFSALRDSEERFRLLIDSIQDYAVFMSDPSGKIVTWNSGAERIYGYTADEAIGSHIGSHFLTEDLAKGQPQHLLDCAAAEGRYEFEGWRVRKNGSRFWASVVVAALRNEDGSLRGFTKLLRDLTDRRRLEEQLRQAQKMEAVGQLAGGVAHDFNNLLTVINGHTEVLLAQLTKEHPYWEAVAEIREAGERAAALTQQLLAFSRKQVLELQVLDLNDVVAHSVKLLRRLIGEDITVTSLLARDLRSVKADPGQLEQVLMNLAVNARDAMPTGGRLIFETRNVKIPSERVPELGELRPGCYVELTVTDTGHGMTDEVKAKIFEPFFTSKGAGKGTGLGLAVVYGVVKQSGGHITFESQLGQGTSFRILLPAEDDAVPVDRPRERSSPIRGTETVLLVEDEEAVRKLLRVVLEMHGYRVLAATCGSDAIHCIAQLKQPVHIVVTDVVMPEMSGRQLVDILRSSHPEVVVLYISGYTDDTVLRHGGLGSTDAFLQKPFTPLSLVKKVREVIDEARSGSTP